MIGSGLVLNAYAGNGMGISYRSPWAGSQPHFLLPPRGMGFAISCVRFHFHVVVIFCRNNMLESGRIIHYNDS